MSKGIRNLVSKRKRRFKQDGYDLDLSYITERLIAMGFPAQKFEGVYRNHIDEVCRFLEDKHKDHYRIYNLCSEKRSYDEGRFHNRVRNFPFADHNPPPLMDIEPLCKDMAEWLTEDPKNVAVVHCKAGKGRTGVMICCYLLHCRSKLLAQDALDFYGDRRTLDRKGVTIPSQRRYVHYYGQLVSSNFNYNPPFVCLRQARMNAPLQSSVNSEVYLVVSSHSNKKGYSSQAGDIRKGKEWIHLPVREEDARPMSEDIKIELKRTNFVRRTEKLFSAWLNTHFILEEGKKVTNGCDINTSDQNNHNTPNIRQRSNSFRLVKHDSFRRKRCETAEPRAPPTGLGVGGSSVGGCNGDGTCSSKEYRETRKKKLGESGSKSLPTGHLTCLANAEWMSTPNGGSQSPPPPHSRPHNRHHHHHHRRRHHTQQLPMVGSARDSWDSEPRPREQEVQTILTKNELDKANKDTHHKLLPEDFRIELWWLVTYVNKGGSNALESRESGSTPSTITPSGSSSDEDDDDDDEEEEGSDWDSDGHCPERYVGRYRLMSDCSAAHPNHYTMPEGPT